MRYLVATRCYWNGRLYDRGEVVDLIPGVEPPEHFKAAEPVPEPEAETTPEPEPVPQSEAAPAPGKRGKKK
jgi:hypothetical protein